MPLPVRTYRTVDEVIDYVNERPRLLALYYFGAQDADCNTLLRRTTSGNVGINNTLMHVAQDDLPFGGVGPSPYVSTCDPTATLGFYL